MKQLTSLAWKEWREVQAFFWVAIFVFLGLPIIGGLEALAQNYARQFNLEASPWVYVFGGVLAVFVAAGTSCRDFHGRLEDFWRSRPVSVNRWLAVKYLVGLAVVVVACWLPLIIEGIVNDHDNRVEVRQLFGMDVGWMPLFWSALYSLAFLAGCLVRRTSHAATLGLAAMLLIYVMPQLIPPLSWMNIYSPTGVDRDRLWLNDDELIMGQIAFSAAMLVITLAAAALALATVRRGWHIESGRKTLYGAVVVAILILCISANYQLGTNLPILQKITLPPHQNSSGIVVDGNVAVLRTDKYIQNQLTPPGQLHPDRSFYKFAITPSGIQIIENQIPEADWLKQPEWAKPDPLYWTRENHEYSESNRIYGATLGIYNARYIGDWSTSVYSRVVPLWKRQAGPQEEFRSSAVLAWQNRLYVIGSRLVTLDITKPFSPKIISSLPFPYEFPKNPFDGSDRVVLNLPPVPDLPPEQRLRAAIGGALPRMFFEPGQIFDGKTLCVTFGTSSVLAYHLAGLSDTSAVFEKIGEYEPSPVERMFGARELHVVQLLNGLLYVVAGPDRGLRFNMRLTVLDTRGGRLKVVGHFAGPDFGSVDPLPDGRIIVSSADDIFLLGPPPNLSHN